MQGIQLTWHNLQGTLDYIELPSKANYNTIGAIKNKQLGQAYIAPTWVQSANYDMDVSV